MSAPNTQPTQVSEPVLLSASTLRSDPALIVSIMKLVNTAFKRHLITEPGTWDIEERGLWDVNNPSEFADRLSEEGVMGVIYNSTSEVVAAAGVKPWTGGFYGEEGRKEDGWEVVGTVVDERFLKQGLNIKLMKTLEEWVVRKEKEKLKAVGDSKNGASPEKGVVHLWVHVAECSNGPYWRKRGFMEMRRQTFGKGVWNCLTSFEMLISRRDVEFEVEP